MNIHHLKYFIALAKRNNYREAAVFCNVSQPAISMAIKSMETKLGAPLFKRHKNPVELTEFGEKIYHHGLRIISEYEQMMAYQDSDGVLRGHINLGVIPTIASALIPLFIGQFIKDYPHVKVNVEELTTSNVINKIKKDELDAGVIATPIDNLKLKHDVLYYEEFMVYSSDKIDKDYLLPSDIEIKELWLLEEGHCLRSQIMNLCELKAKTDGMINYNAGSIDTLLNLVDTQGGLTIVPELAVKQLSAYRRKRLSMFNPPAPVREVSLVSHPYNIKRKQLEAVLKTIDKVIPNYMKDREDVVNPPITLTT